MPRRQRKSEVYFPEHDEDRLDNLRNSTMSDRHLLIKLKECEDRDGLIDPADVAEALNIQATDHRTPAGTVSIRLAWMRRYGLLERIDPLSIGLRRVDGYRYRITKDGDEIRKSKLTAPVVRELAKAGLGTRVMLMGEITRAEYNGNGGGVHAKVLRRQFLNASGQR